MFLVRSWCLVAGTAGVATGFWSRTPRVKTPLRAQRTKPLVDVPLTRLHIPEGAVGKDLVLVAVELDGAREEFVLDTGTSCELITPELRSRLATTPKNKNKNKNATRIAATMPGGRGDFEMTELENAHVEGVAVGSLHAVVADFPLEHVDAAHDVRGILGLEFMRRFDVDVDCLANRLRLWAPGDGAADAERRGLCRVPCFYNGGMLATRAAGADDDEPFLAMVDTGSSLTVMTTAAARLVAGEAALDDATSPDQPHPGVLGVGVDAKPTALPLLDDVRLALVGVEDAQRYHVPAGLRAAVGDLRVFTLVFGDDLGAGPTAILGMDLWHQGRTLFCGGDRLGGTALFWTGDKDEGESSS